MKNQDGSIAIISIMLMFFILTSLALAMSFAGYTGRMNTLEAEYFIRSRALAHACQESALARLAIDRAYAGGDTIDLNGDTCIIVSVISVSGGLNRIITTSSTIQHASITLRTEIKMKDFSTLSLEEMP